MLQADTQMFEKIVKTFGPSLGNGLNCCFLFNANFISQVFSSFKRWHFKMSQYGIFIYVTIQKLKLHIM